MRSPLHSRISDLRGRVRRLLALHGLSLVIAGLAVFTLLACLADWSIHLAREIRVGLLIGFVALAGYLLLRYVVRPLIVRFRDLDIAMKIENRWPGLNDRLASTIQFLDLERAGVGDRDDLLGSRALREATVKQTLEETESIDFRSVVDPRPARKAMLIGAGAVALGLAVFALDTRLGTLAVKRLFLPFASNPWPQMTHLAILQAPEKVAKGEPFVLEVGIAKGERAPSFAKVTYKYEEDGETATESLRPDAKNRFHGRKETVEKSFSFTVAAGDDATAPRKVQVVPPPVITGTTIKLIYPGYTGIASQILATSKNTITAVAGTTVEITATTNKPIASASLTGVEGQTPLAVAVNSHTPTSLSARFTLAESGPLTFALKDTEGFRSQEKDAVRLDFRSIKDEAPKVVIEDPANDKDVTTNASIPFTISADDDFGLGNIRLVYKTSLNGSEPANEVIIPLWNAAGTSEKPGTIVKNHEIKHVWNLEPLKLPAGAVLTIHADSRDLDNLKGPNIGKSRELRLRIVTPEQLMPQIIQERKEIGEEIDRALTMQRQAIPPVRDANRAIEKTGTVDAARRDELKNAEPIQQQITDRIGNKTDGLEAKIRKHLENLDNLKIDNPDAKAQMQRVLEGVEKIRDENVDPAEQGVSRANRALDEAAGEKPQSPNQQNGESSKNQDGATQKSASNKASEKTAGAQGQSKSKNASAKSDEASKSSVSAKAEVDTKSGETSKTDAAKGDADAKSGMPKTDSAKSDAAKSGQSKSDAAKSGEASKSDAAKSGEPKTGESSKSETDDSGESSKSAAAKSGQPKSAQSKKGQSKSQQGEPKVQDAAQPESPSSVKDSLSQAEQNQKAIADELQKMRDELGEFETFRGVVQDAKKLVKDQDDAMKALAEEAKKADLADKKPENLTDQQKADLSRAAEMQKDVAQNLARLENKMDEMAKRLEATDPATAAALKDAAQQSREKGTTGKMDNAAQGAEKNQMGQAQQDQKQAQQDVKKLVDNLQNRRENELARLVKDLKEAEKEINKLKNRQANNREQTGKAKDNPDAQARKEQLQKLSKEQKQIQADLKKQLLKLQKARADVAAQAGDKAAAKMAQAGQEQEEGDADDAEKMQEEALAGLEEVQDEIEQAREDAEEQLAMEQLSKIKDNLLGLSDRQAKMSEDTAEYEKAKLTKGLTRAQRAGVQSLGRVQDALKDETDELTERLDAAPAFALQLKKAANQMGEAAKKLQAVETDADTQKIETAAHKKIKQLLEALNPNADQENPDGQKPNAGTPPPGGQPGQQQRNRGDGIGLAAQLRVLKALQLEINDRTEALDEIKTRKKSLTPEQQAELEGLSEDQRKIADLARDLTKPKKSDGEQ